MVVTSASTGIGEAIAKKFAEEGANVVLSSREQARVDAARNRIGFFERTLAVACDVRQRGQPLRRRHREQLELAAFDQR